MADCYIYGLVDPRDDRLRYVGKTPNMRYRFWRHTHPNPKDHTHRACWIRGIKAAGLLPRMEVIAIVDKSVEDTEERFYVQLFRAMGADLVNMTDGGGGGTNKGRKLTEEHKAKISASHVGIRPDAATREKMSAQRRGRKQSPETIAKRAAKMCGRKLSAETIEKIRAANLGKKRSPEARTSMSLAAKRRWASGDVPYQMKYPDKVPHGTALPQAKLNDQKVREIRVALATRESLSSIGRRYGVSYVQISRIRDGLTWKHVQC